MPLKIKRTDHGNITVLELEGRLNLGEGSPAFLNAVKDLVNSGCRKIVIVYAGVSFQDSSGNGAIVSAYTTVRNAGGELVLAGVPNAIQDVLQISKLLTVFNVFHTVADALGHFEGKG